jgi:hypothetical protein
LESKQFINSSRVVKAAEVSHQKSLCKRFNENAALSKQRQQQKSCVTKYESETMGRYL